MQQTIEQLDLTALDFTPALPCEFPDCLSRHEQPATFRLLTDCGPALPDGTHIPEPRLACTPCYEWLVQHPTRHVMCPVHGQLGAIRDWWTLLGMV